jgi:hypothetical protein
MHACAAQQIEAAAVIPKCGRLNERLIEGMDSQCEWVIVDIHLVINYSFLQAFVQQQQTRNRKRKKQTNIPELVSTSYFLAGAACDDEKQV